MAAAILTSQCAAAAGAGPGAYFGGGADGADAEGGWGSAAALTCAAVSFSSWTNLGVMVFMRP